MARSALNPTLLDHLGQRECNQLWRRPADRDRYELFAVLHVGHRRADGTTRQIRGGQFFTRRFIISN